VMIWCLDFSRVPFRFGVFFFFFFCNLYRFLLLDSCETESLQPFSHLSFQYTERRYVTVVESHCSSESG